MATPLLITGVGDTVGQALIKTARASAVPCRILGSDRDPLAVGLRWVDEAFVLPHCSDTEVYLREICRVCTGAAVKLIMPGSEKELLVLSEHAARIQAESGATVVGSSPEALRIALDKWETCRFLEKHALNFPSYARAEREEEVERLVETAGFPLIAKPRQGTGAIGFSKVHAPADLAKVRALGRPMVLQEYLLPDEEEYSVEVYTTRAGEQVGAISYRRGQLIAGDTFKAYVAQNEPALAEAARVARALQPLGPCNVQLRITARGPVTFEVNPRFSGGASMRAHFGFNEVEMALRDLVRDERVPAPKITSGWAMRFWEETYYDDETPGAQQAAACTPFSMAR
jgi:carbamoyl-phosphate synthase large subunit